MQRYLARVSGPLLDRIDIHLEVPAVKYRALADQGGGEASEAVRERVDRARELRQVAEQPTPAEFLERLRQREPVKLRVSPAAIIRAMREGR